MSNYTKENICAIIVCFNCTEIINKNICSLLRQVNRVLIIDNASSIINKKLLFDWERDERVTMIWNQKNEGVAFALNQGLAFAKTSKFKLILTMDQDTILCDDAVGLMIRTLNTNNAVVSVGPARKKNMNSKVPYEIVDYLITSGNLTLVKAALKANGFSNNFFIDSVDIDFSIRLRASGYKLARVNNSHMAHKVGEFEHTQFLLWDIKYLSHSPLRHYYIYRNHIIIFKKYSFEYPYFCCKMLFFLTVDTLKIFLYHSHKKEKFRMIAKGLKDGFKNSKTGVDKFP